MIWTEIHSNLQLLGTLVVEVTWGACFRNAACKFLDLEPEFYKYNKCSAMLLLQRLSDRSPWI